MWKSGLFKWINVQLARCAIGLELQEENVNFNLMEKVHCSVKVLFDSFWAMGDVQ